MQSQIIHDNRNSDAEASIAQLIISRAWQKAHQIQLGLMKLHKGRIASLS